MSRIAAGLGFVVLASLGAFAAARISITNDISHFIPGDENEALVEFSKALSGAELTRTMILSLSAPTIDEAIRASTELRDALVRDENVERIQNGVTPGTQDAFRELYFARRHYFQSDHPRSELPGRLSAQGLSSVFARLRSELALPTGGLARAVAAEDPVLVMLDRVRALDAMRTGSLKLRDGVFVSDDETHAFVFLTTRASAFDGATQGPFLSRLDQLFARVQAAHRGRLRLEQSGMQRFAVEAEGHVRNDIARISIISTICVILFTLLLFRSLRFLVLTAVPVIAGMAAAILVTYLVFHRVHGITLAFGCALIGVTEDYPVHLLNHHMFAANGALPKDSLKRVWGGLSLGVATTAAGLLGFAWTPFPGMREIAVFSSVGVLAALLATRYFVTPFMPSHPSPAPAQRRLADAFERMLAHVRRRRGLVWTLWILILAVIAFGIPQLKWNDDISALSEVNEALKAEDTRVRMQVSSVEPARLVIARGATEEEALVRNDAVHEALVQAEGASELASHRSLHSVLWSADLQRTNLAMLREQPQLAARVETASVAAGFTPGAFAPFIASISGPQPAPLTFSDLASSPLASVVTPLRMRIGHDVALLTFLRGVNQPGALAQRIARIPGASYFDQKAFLARAYGSYRARTLELVAFGLFGVLAVAWLRYRKLRHVLAVCLPAWAAAGATLGLLGLAHADGNLMHLLSLVIVLSMGIDYGIFMVEHRRGSELSSTLLAVVTASVTTILSFGLLALSSNPALRSLGVAVGIGMTISMVLSPLALLSLGADERAP
ncbi:MAG: MMPL family transporter [Sandaracinaceae bacterium]|nr:MMPL family transporter [Sandaracinaceae bacterium]